MKLTIEISLDNAAFDNDQSGETASGSEVAYTLTKLAGNMRDMTLAHNDAWPIRDVNGNRIGNARIRGRRA